MEQMTTEKRVLLVKTFYKNDGSPTATFRKLRAKFGCNVAPNESSVRGLVKKFETSDSVLNLKKKN